jgi:hypothetical protein
VNLPALLVDGLIAGAIAIAVLIITPGVAVAAMLAVLVLTLFATIPLLRRRRARRPSNHRRSRR